MFGDLHHHLFNDRYLPTLDLFFPVNALIFFRALLLAQNHVSAAVQILVRQSLKMALFRLYNTLGLMGLTGMD